MTLLLGILGASLLGSLHCAAMCGGFVCFYAAGPRTSWPAHVAYNGGRLVTYLTLGAIAGAVGASVDSAGALLGVSRLATVIAGTLLILWGTSTVLALRGIRMPAFAPGARSRITAPVARVIRALRDRPPVLRALGTGIVTTMIPCGWLYAFVATAGSTGRVSTAMLAMTVFWAGTLPVLVGLGVGAQRAIDPLRRRLPVLTATAVVILGLLTLAGRLAPPHAGSDARDAHAVHGNR